MAAPALDIYGTLAAAMTGTDLALPADAFGPGGIEDILKLYFPGGVLAAGNVALERTNDGASFSKATGGAGPLNAMSIAARFAQGGDGVTLFLTADAPAGWTLARGWPLLAGDWPSAIPFSKATFTLSSVAIATAPAGPVKGLVLDGTAALGPGWSELLWLLGGSGSLRLQGPVGQQGQVPSFDFAVPVGTIELPVLGALPLSLVVRCAPVTGRVTPPGAPGAPRAVHGGNGGGGPVASAWVPRLDLGLSAGLALAASPVPIFIDLAEPAGLLGISADLSHLSLVSLADFAALLPGADLQSVMPPATLFDPGKYLEIKELNFLLAPHPAKLVSAGILLQTTSSWSVTHGVSVGPVSVQFTVAAGGGPVMAALTGPVKFEGGSLDLGAYHPGFVFAGGLAPGSRIELADLMSKLLPISLDAKLLLEELDFVVHGSSGSFSLTTGLSGDWTIPVGVATIDLTRAWLQLDRDGGSTTGAITLEAVLTPDVGGPVRFAGSWTLPGGFALNAGFRDIDLSTLAECLTGTGPPDGVPDISLTGSQVAITLDSKSGDYSFALDTHVAIGGHGVGTGLFEIRKTPAGHGFLIGVIVPESWSPGEIWPELAPLFAQLNFSKSGLAVSTLPAGSATSLPNFDMPSVPATLGPGFTFFTSLALTGDILGPVSSLFDDHISFDLLAVVDTATPADSQLVASLGGSGGKGAIVFTGVEIVLKPEAESVSLSAGATLTIHGESLDLKGSGSIAVGAAPQISFTIEVDHWVHPFGIDKLTIDAFGLKVEGEEEQLTIDVLGAFDIGSSPRSFTFVVGTAMTDFEEPSGLVFELTTGPSQPTLMLSDLIEEFTSLDLSSVPVLNAIGFKELKFWLIADPAGFTIAGYTFPQGIGVVGDILIYSWEAKFNIQVSSGKGIVASGSINEPITLGSVFSLSGAADDTKGPSGSIDTSSLASRAAADAAPYMTLDGKVTLLEISDSIHASVSKSSFDFEMAFDFAGLATVTLDAQLIDDKNFAALASFDFDLNVTLGPLTVGGITLIPEVNIDGPDCGFNLGVAINPTVVAQLSIGLDFSWEGLDLHPSFTLSAGDIGGDLGNLFNSVIQWLKDNVESLFSSILGDVGKWVAAVEHVFTELAGDIENIAKALANYFGTAAADAAAYLKQLGFEAEAIAKALVDYFGMAADEAWHLVESLWNDCAMTSAMEQAEPGSRQGLTVEDLRFALTGLAGGRRILLVRYGHGDEVWRLLAPCPVLRNRIRNLAASPRRFKSPHLLLETAITTLTAVAPRASPALRGHIDELVPMLMDLRTKSWGELARALER